MAGQRTLESVRVDYPAPPHVPKDLLVDLSWAQGYLPSDLVDPYEPFGWLSGPDIPRLLYTPAVPGVSAEGMGVGSAGTWVVTHYEDIDRVYTDNALFSNRGTAEFQALIGETFPSIPLAIDPPDHHKYRMFLMPHFSPARITRMEGEIRDLVREMIGEFAGRGEVDIAWDFARAYPVRIFMRLMGFPEPMFEQFLAWEWDILHSNSNEKMAAALRGVLAFLRGFIAEREADPDDHLVSAIIHGKIEGETPTEDEKIGMVWFLWLGGLDTVAATISQMYRRMALQPEIQARLRADPSLVPTAVEEFLRTQPILNTARRVKQDFEWHGVTLKAGDRVQCYNAAGNFDPARFDDPREFDPTRKSNRHFTFVAGVHLCLGAPLARRELRILLDEWFKHIPEFRIKHGADISVFPGLLSIRNLPLVWDVA
ncbi:cytochrome P450 [Sphingomonas bacterium]|uniref:cytochrome P450 n=1 Tax=Sphingomonas bacterium TaxID=1895847 RepID=UPI00157527D1|nr:cytochrome P450 [Sphingomonas bacterium]